ncbi:Na(+)/H(+) antiporter NhaA [Aquimixticola soesokkakensis]|uniref:Na(+)/H(+) antiporter NhaA n=1 Tax=Aquimixticola soesokkakensis TaxID=1519096 RepID=A0A1Y5SYN5_9RHOB|nr:Na+/H+ antiporter NhaA [Aquimixticola soesokkakensis]SLN49536.1 Na(+)/H(+) antiporter NhaA [Aquimixticola soesokkakensis]
MLLRSLEDFFDSDTAGGLVLVASAVAALAIANSSLYPYYEGLLSAPFTIALGDAELSKSLLLWINDGLMAVFFLLVGLELKRERLEGKLRNPSDIVLPGVAALGGMMVPALIFAAINWHSADTLSGWAIPSATDIAFAVGVMALVGQRLPGSLRVFLLTLAILDDLGAILIIAFFYASDLQVDYLFLAIIPLFFMWYLNRAAIHRPALIIMLGIVLWVLILQSGIEATLAGVITAFFIPMRDKWGKSPAHALENALSPYVFFLIVPIFVLANAGVVLSGFRWSIYGNPIVLGVALGLFVGKQLGVFGTTWLLIKFGIARKPFGATWRQVYGVAVLAGIGFTMSLFIGGLSYSSTDLMNQVRIGVLTGSIGSAVIGYLILRLAPLSQEQQAAIARGETEARLDIEPQRQHESA